MLQQLNDQLRSVQVIDQSKLAASFGLMQGFQSRDTSQSLSVATPFTTTKQTFDANTKPTGTEKDTTPGGSGAAPALPDLQADPTGFAPVYGNNPEDLLTDQVNLSYQIFNLRLLLERSLTDRLWLASSDAHATPRLQAIIGFNVNVTPPKFARGKAAVVEITVTPAGEVTDPVSLVAVMPQEKTYNSAALSKSATAFGGSAVAKIVTIGYSYRRRSEKLYLFRDADTVSFERTHAHATEARDVHSAASEPGAVTFGWEFRPVLGRASVSPGERQMFAVVAFPTGDGLNPSPQDHPRAGFPFDVKVRTYWKKYYRDKLTTKMEVTAPDSADFSNIRAPFTAESQFDLAPRINHVNWLATGPDTAVVTVDGENFFSGTSVVLGNRTYSSPSDGLIFKSDESFQLNTSISALASGDVVINGRYGTSRLIYPDPEPDPGISILTIDLIPNPARLLWPLNLKIRARGGMPSTLMGLRSNIRLDPVITVAGKPIPGPYQYQEEHCDLPQPGRNLTESSTCVLIQAFVPADVAKSEAPIGIRFPLLGPKWADSMVYYDPSQVLKVGRVGGGARTTLVVSGEAFDDGATVQLDHLYRVPPGDLVLVNRTLLTLDVDTPVLAQFKSLIVSPSNGARPTVLDIPASKPDAPKAKLDDGQKPSTTVGSAQAVTFTGSGLSAITAVRFERELLPFKTADDAKSIQVFLSRRVTSTDGTVQVLLTSADGGILPASLVVNAKPLKSK